MANPKFKDAAFYNRDKGRVWYPKGTAPTFRSTDYKDPVKIMITRKKRNEHCNNRLAKPETT